MRNVARLAGCLSLGLVAAVSAAQAQNTLPASTSSDRSRPDRILQPVATSEPAVHTMEIYNGAIRTVSYFSPLGTRTQQEALANLSRAENQVKLADQLLVLRRQYAADESRLQARRTGVQERSYGIASAYDWGYPIMAYPGYLGFNAFGGFTNLMIPFVNYANGPFLSFALGGPAYGAPYYGGGTSQGLTNGVGDEGVLKLEIAKTMAQQATPDYLAQVSRAYDAALARVGESKEYRSALKLGDRPAVVPAAGTDETRPTRVKVTTRSGQTYEGNLVREDKEWVVLTTADGTLDLARSEVKSLLRTQPKKTPPPPPTKNPPAPPKK